MNKQKSFLIRVGEWLLACFGGKIADDKTERSHRFAEESLELVQALGCTKEEVLKLVDYVFNRPLGEPSQEVGGVLVTLAALCRANKIDMNLAGETELKRVWKNIDKIREKQANKPQFSPLPEHTAYPNREPYIASLTGNTSGDFTDVIELSSDATVYVDGKADINYLNRIRLMAKEMGCEKDLKFFDYLNPKDQELRLQQKAQSINAAKTFFTNCGFCPSDEQLGNAFDAGILR